jgi:glycosyltransferase involved in cell wall biosynthesis
MRIKKVSIIIPAFNEGKTIALAIKRVQSVRLPNIHKEIIVIDDGSTDETWKNIKNIKSGNVLAMKVSKNMGKGAAIRLGLEKFTGEVVIIQDADLEYNPADYPILLTPIIENGADVVYGSRFVTGQSRRVIYFWHSVVNVLLTMFSNMLTNLNLTDMETGYKAFTADVARKLNIQENRFGFEPEFTAKVAGMKCKIFEVGISYSGRSYAEGKKINWKDGVWALGCLVRYNLPRFG